MIDTVVLNFLKILKKFEVNSEKIKQLKIQGVSNGRISSRLRK